MNQLLTVKDVAKLLGVTRQTVSRMIEMNQLPYVKISKRYFFPRDKVMKILQINEHPEKGDIDG